MMTARSVWFSLFITFNVFAVSTAHDIRHLLQPKNTAAKMSGTLKCGDVETLAEGVEFQIEGSTEQTRCVYLFSVEENTKVTLSCSSFGLMCSELEVLGVRRYFQDREAEADGLCKNENGLSQVPKEFGAEAEKYTLEIAYQTEACPATPAPYKCTIVAFVDPQRQLPAADTEDSQRQPQPRQLDDSFNGPDCGKFKAPVQRIRGGEVASEGQYPWAVHMTVKTSSGDVFCGGSIISKYWILTAAHCLPYDTTEVKFCIGSLSRTNCLKEISSPARYIVRHYGGNACGETDRLNDIAMIKLKEGLDFNDNIRPVCVADAAPDIDSEMEIIGWGNDGTGGSTDALKRATTKVVHPLRCPKKDPKYHLVCLDRSDAEQTSGVGGACVGDSGGYAGAVRADGKAVQHGVASLVKDVLVVNQNRACLGSPDGYTDVSAYKGWIEDVMSGKPSV